MKKLFYRINFHHFKTLDFSTTIVRTPAQVAEYLELPEIQSELSEVNSIVQIFVRPILMTDSEFDRWQARYIKP